MDLEPGTLIYDNKEKILIRKWSVESNIFYTTGIYTTNKGRTVIIKYYYYKSIVVIIMYFFLLLLLLFFYIIFLLLYLFFIKKIISKLRRHVYLYTLSS